MTGNDALRLAIPRLRAAGIVDPSLDARILLAHAMSVPSDRLTLHLADTLSPEMELRLDGLLSARETRQPVSQILGSKLFWGRSFAVTSDVLDPRPETEMLIAEALSAPFHRVLDLGTGSGCILLTLLLERPGSTGIGVDLSTAALVVAQDNLQRFGLLDAASLHQGSWFEPVAGVFDLIVSNPPYIAEAEMAGLSPEVRDWEPHLALTPGGDGLDAYRNIIAGAPERLKPGGRLMVEIGPTQAAAVSAMMRNAGLTGVQVVMDFDLRDRVVQATKPV